MYSTSPVLSYILGQTKEHIESFFVLANYIMLSQVDGVCIPFTIPFMITIEDLTSEVLIHMLLCISLQDLIYSISTGFASGFITADERLQIKPRLLFSRAGYAS